MPENENFRKRASEPESPEISDLNHNFSLTAEDLASLEFQSGKLRRREGVVLGVRRRWLLGVLLHEKNLNDLQVGIDQPKLLHAGPRIHPSLAFFIQKRSLWRQDFHHKIGRAFRA